MQNNLPSIIAAVFPSVSDAPIRLQGKLVEHVFESPIEIASSLKNYYTNETLKQVYKIIGSLDFVGNPTILLSSFMSGVKDLVSIPTAAFMKSPANVKEVGIGVGKGTVSFLSHSASGFFGFSARLFSQAGQGMALFSFDSDYRQWHRDRVVNEATNLERAWKRRGMPTAEEIILRPAADLVLGFTLGVSGVVMSPYRGAKKDGVKGFVVGTGRGVAGLVTKPIVGVFDMMTHASQSIHDIAKTANFLERRHHPVLKLRLPHVFGPMKILTPFDVISSRSVYLLGLFPPKSKLKHRRDDGREIYVHSEVLNMEPGVETYAVVTNIRVVLIKLRRGTANVLAPTFGWEAELAGGATISSQISDHGHNGVALMITTSSNGVPHQSGKLSKKVSEMTMKTRRASTASSNLFLQDVEGFADDDEAGKLGDDFQSIHLSTNTPMAKPLSESLSAGVTKKGNKTLEWFTVLAEYQQRNQLTRLHNVISCIVGNYDDVISDRTQTHANPHINGTTSFGIYKFEKGLPDGRAAKISNTKVVASLENLYWLESTLAQRIDKISSPDRKQRALNKVHNSWDFSNDMKASENLGGPEWLIMARAKAMCIRKELKEFESTRVEILDENQEVSHFFPEKKSGHGSISSGNQFESAQVLGTSTLSDISGGPSTISMHDLNTNHSANSRSWNATTSNTIATNRAQMNSMEKSEEEVHEINNVESGHDSYAMEEDFYSPVNDMVIDSRQGEESHGEAISDDQHEPPVPSLYVHAQHDQDVNASNSRTATLTPTLESSRIDRLEGVMEQLMLLNAAQAHRGATVSDPQPSPPESKNVHELATLMHELTEIREKMEERAREDEALRQEIGMLRDQLAEKRSAGAGSDAGTTESKRNAGRPPAINTQFMKTNPIRGIFNNRKKNKAQNRSQSVSIGSSDRNETNSLPSFPENIQNLEPLGFNDERSGSQSMLS